MAKKAQAKTHVTVRADNQTGELIVKEFTDEEWQKRDSSEDWDLPDEDDQRGSELPDLRQRMS
jgi:hypothetical protein